MSNILKDMKDQQRRYELFLFMHVLCIIPERLRSELGISNEMQLELAELATTSSNLFATIPVAIGTALQNNTDMTNTDRQVLAQLLDINSKAIAAGRVVTAASIDKGLVEAIKKTVEDGKKWADKQGLPSAPLNLDTQLEEAEKLVRAAATYNREAYDNPAPKS